MDVSETPAPDGPAYDLEERTAVFGEQVIRLCRTIQQNAITRPLITQLVRSATSIGANYDEADEAGTTKEFRHRISLCKREARETKRWLRMLAVAVPEQADRLRPLWKEAVELNLIFGSIHRRSGPQDGH